MSDVMHLSPSIAATLLQRSPLRAWQAHSKGGAVPSDVTDEMRRGKLIDRLLFKTGCEVVIVDADSWRTNVAKAAREEAEARGAIAVLAHKHEEADKVANEIRALLYDRDINLNDGKCQHRVVWDSAGVACKGFIDLLLTGEDSARIFDLKITDNAAPSSIKLDMRAQLQHAAYVEAIETLNPEMAGRVTCQFIFAEPDGTDLSIVEPDGMLASMATSRWKRAVAQWGACLASGKWPGYSRDVYRVEAKPWEMDAELAQGIGAQAVPF